MKTINVDGMVSGDSKTEFEKVSPTEVLEYVVSVRSRSIAELQQQAGEIDQATMAREERISRDYAHTAKLREIANIAEGEKVVIDKTH